MMASMNRPFFVLFSMSLTLALMMPGAVSRVWGLDNASKENYCPDRIKSTKATAYDASRPPTPKELYQALDARLTKQSNILKESITTIVNAAGINTGDQSYKEPVKLGFVPFHGVNSSDSDYGKLATSFTNDMKKFDSEVRKAKMANDQHTIYRIYLRKEGFIKRAQQYLLNFCYQKERNRRDREQKEKDTINSIRDKSDASGDVF